MKNLFLALLLACGLMSFTTTNEPVVDAPSPIVTTIQLEESEDGYTPCCWIICDFVNGILVGCSEVECGICLDEIVIPAN